MLDHAGKQLDRQLHFNAAQCMRSQPAWLPDLRREPRCCEIRRWSTARFTLVIAWTMAGIPGDLAEIPETEQIMPETSAQEPSLPPVPATVADIMRPPLTTVQPNDHVAAAAYLMRHEAATALVVLDGQTNRAMGLITEADIVQLVADGRDADAVRIHALMTTRLSVIRATSSIREAANIMITGRFRHLPVVEEAGLIGMIDITDICRALLDAPGE